METYPSNFLGLDAADAAYDTARYAVLSVPYEATTSFRSGTRFGPRAILAASEEVEWFDEELGDEFHQCGICTMDPLGPDHSGPEAMQQAVYRAARRVVRDGKFPLTLGGEHGITPALVRAVAARHKNLSVLQIDAHADLRDQYENTPYSHACAMRRVLETVDTIVPVGIRNLSREEHRFAQRAGIDLITARQCLASDEWIDHAIDRLTPKVYVTIDIDGFDPAIAPGTGTPEPGGLDWYAVLALLRLVAAEKTIVGADIVEVAPIPGQVVTEFLAARLAYKIIAYRQAAEQGTL
jgi:agmatinase